MHIRTFTIHCWINILIVRKIFYLFLVSSLIISCEDDLGNVGLGLIPDKDILEVCLDSSTKVSSTFVNDDTISSRSYTVMLGGVTDPVLGSQKAHIFSRFYWDRTNYFSLTPDYLIHNVTDTIESDKFVKSYKVDLDSILIDSIVIIMGMDNYIYGEVDDTSLLHSFKVYDLGEDFDTMIYHNYYTHGEIPTNFMNSPNNILIAEKTQMLIQSDTIYKYLKFKVENQDFIDKIETLITKNYITGTHIDNLMEDSTYFEDSLFYFIADRNRILTKKFKGLFFETTDAKLMANFTNPQIRIYCNTPNDKFQILLNTVTSSFLNYDGRDDNFLYLSPLTFFENNLLQDNNLGVDNLPTTYVGGGLSYKTQIKLYELDKWFENDSVLFNEFSIEIPFDTTHANSYSPPEVLNLTCKNSHVDYDYTWTAKIVLEDRYNSDGKLVTPRSASYKFYPTNFLYDFQNNRKDKKDFTSITDYIFEITDPSNYNDVDRVILNCGENSENIKVNIIYTKYK